MLVRARKPMKQPVSVSARISQVLERLSLSKEPCCVSTVKLNLPKTHSSNSPTVEEETGA